MMFVLLFLIYCSNANIVKYSDLALKKCSDNDTWTIHGWWPEYSTNKWPMFCDKSKYHLFNKTAIQPLVIKLMDVWQSCMCDTPAKAKVECNYNFWKHEWEKHGTCTNETVVSYFKNTINVYFQSKYYNWYECCNHSGLGCLIPFSKNETIHKWLGYCHL